MRFRMIDRIVEVEPGKRLTATKRLREDEEYLYGVDCYNHGYLWEAHEAWEGLWHQAKGTPAHAECLQGLIQCAAAALKVSRASLALNVIPVVTAIGAWLILGERLSVVQLVGGSTVLMAVILATAPLPGSAASAGSRRA